MTAATNHPQPASASPVGRPPAPVAPRVLGWETALVLGVSLGSSAIYALLSLIEKLSRNVVLSDQVTTMNSSVTPDRPWLDVAFQLAGIVLGVVPAALSVYLLARDDSATPGLMHRALRRIGFDLTSPRRDVLGGVALTALIGIPGLALYLGARELGLNTTVAAANLSGAMWWTIPLLIGAAAQNAILEEVVMVGYLVTRWRQAGWAVWAVVGVSALIRGGYHLYQGFGGFVGNVVMGLIFGAVYLRWRRVGPLVVAHTLLDVVAFVGYSLLAPHVGWL